MRFIWDDLNIAHVARHQLTPAQVDAVLDAADVGWSVLEDGRILIEGSVEPGMVRVVVVAVADDAGALYVITAHRIHHKRRRSPPWNR
jgi:hypothetical protein